MKVVSRVGGKGQQAFQPVAVAAGPLPVLLVIDAEQLDEILKMEAEAFHPCSLLVSVGVLFFLQVGKSSAPKQVLGLLGLGFDLKQLRSFWHLFDARRDAAWDLLGSKTRTGGFGKRPGQQDLISYMIYQKLSITSTDQADFHSAKWQFYKSPPGSHTTVSTN